MDQICKRVAGLRKLEEDEYANLCGLNPVVERGRIKELHQGYEWLAPDYLARVVDQVAVDIKGLFPSEHLDLIKMLIAAAAYGPRRCGPPPNLSHLEHGVAQWRVDSTQRALERVLVYGALLPNTPGSAPPSWERRWEFASDTLLYLVRSTYLSREKPRSKTKRPRPGAIERNLWWMADGQRKWISPSGIADHAERYAARVVDSLVSGCNCRASWAEMRFEERERRCFPLRCRAFPPEVGHA